MAGSIDVECVFDASCLIAFARVGRVDLLVDTFRARAYSPQEVRIELEQGRDDKPHTTAIRADEWLSWVSLDTGEELDTFGENLRYVGSRGRGEAATIALAAHRGFTAVLDDLVARNRANALGVRYVGTLGIVADFVVAGHLDIDAGWSLLESMRGEEFRLKVTGEEFACIVERRR